MALQNGVLVHGRTSWACAVRDTDGTLHVSSGRKPHFAPEARSRMPMLRGPIALAEAFALLPWCARFLEPAFHSSGRLCSGRSPRRRSPLALRRSSLPAGARARCRRRRVRPGRFEGQTSPHTTVPSTSRSVRTRTAAPGAEGAPTVWIAAHCADGRLVPRRERRRIQSTRGDSRGCARARPRGRRGRLGRALLLGR